ncbi:MAG: hypothetical protein ABSE63_03595 [Thermoguttaceae bacterium]|jgi:hypothetical protein
MTRLICLANSRRDGGRCVAGIDIASGLWVRPVPPRGGAIPEEKTFLSGRLFTPLDIIELELDPPAFATRFQCENRLMQNWNWRLAGRVNAGDLLKYCTWDKTVLHGPGKTVQPSDLELLPPQKWTSLQLIHSTNVTFEPDPRIPIRWQARFSLVPAGPAYCLSITDPEATLRLNKKQRIKPECLLTVSLTEPKEFKEYGKPELCYKLVAAVIEL